MSVTAPAAVTAVVDELVTVFEGVFTRAEVAFVVEDSWQDLQSHSRTPHFLTALLRKDARDRLTQMAHYRGLR
ncbi:hypothetical protein AVL62_10640 [Serinicoccus chungangensis]|uniref:Protein-tyrosine-phosphatase-like N-terminal domain-containing protein n=1 Tax=Serinicoccus chungangensis TaxID=767452 RepID=A0A0W8IEK3_9MICO|nr:hypothetical protein [Serinicoccus chungangensis]KUG58366.1 hypothetical protein AVL62_10640 [Serinicoccus chungangensis]